MKSFIPQELRPKVSGSNISLSSESTDIIELMQQLSLQDILELGKRYNVVLKIISNIESLADEADVSIELLNQLRKIFVPDRGTL